MCNNALRDARTKAGFTQDRLAILSGVSQSEISLLENGNRKPGPVTRARLASVLGIDPFTDVASEDTARVA